MRAALLLVALRACGGRRDADDFEIETPHHSFFVNELSQGWGCRGVVDAAVVVTRRHDGEDYVLRSCDYPVQAIQFLCSGMGGPAFDTAVAAVDRFGRITERKADFRRTGAPSVDCGRRWLRALADYDQLDDRDRRRGGAAALGASPATPAVRDGRAAHAARQRAGPAGERLPRNDGGALRGRAGASAGAYDFVFLDGATGAPEVLQDLVLADVLLAVGGLLLVDDVGFPGVAAAAKAFYDVNGARYRVILCFAQLALVKEAAAGGDGEDWRLRRGFGPSIVVNRRRALATVAPTALPGGNLDSS
ncbi:methyltransferase domain-containing protein [Aureococcus anophagefferens]|nr:methyltransferase domain-containing protein [Aureococcus anophagefferens]